MCLYFCQAKVQTHNQIYAGRQASLVVPVCTFVNSGIFIWVQTHNVKSSHAKHNNNRHREILRGTQHVNKAFKHGKERSVNGRTLGEVWDYLGIIKPRLCYYSLVGDDRIYCQIHRALFY